MRGASLAAARRSSLPVAPAYVSVAKTMARFTGDGWKPRRRSGTQADTARLLDAIEGETSCVVVQYPDILGRISDLSERRALPCRGSAIGRRRDRAVALGAIRSPGEMGRTSSSATGQSIGVGLNFGGPMAACSPPATNMSARCRRLAGETVDAEGSAASSHPLDIASIISAAEKATSNSARTAALRAGFLVHMTLLGERTETARRTRTIFGAEAQSG